MTCIDLVKAGMALVAIPFMEKGPTHPGWNERSQCITNVNDCWKLGGKNIGLAHAYCTPTPTCAIDIDDYIKAKDWLTTHGIDLNLLLKSRGVAVIWSGKRNSLKILYRLPEGCPPFESKKINGPEGKCMLEFRCATKEGKTVQHVLPPSVHPEGHVYQWMGDCDPFNPTVIPQNLMSLWDMLIHKQVRVARRQFFTSVPMSHRQESPRQIAIIQSALQHINADCPYEIWRNVVWAVLSTNWTRAESIAESWSRTAPYRYDDDAFWLLVNSYMPNHQTPITVGTIYHYARQGGWDE